MNFAQRLADFALQAQPDAAARDAQTIMALSLYDWMACGLVGANEPVANILRSTKPAPTDTRSSRSYFIKMGLVSHLWIRR